MKKIFLDTNFLMIPGSLKIDIFSEIARIIDEPCELYVLDKSIDELNGIMDKQKGKEKSAAKMALQLIELKNIKILVTKQKSLNMPINSKKSIVDDILVSISDSDTIVATQDSLLKKTLAAKGIKTLILRSKKKLEIR
jgi:uncharacterized protein